MSTHNLNFLNIVNKRLGNLRNELIKVVIDGLINNKNFNQGFNTLLLLETIENNVESQKIDNLMTIDDKTSPIFNTKNGMFKKNKKILRMEEVIIYYKFLALW